MTPERKAYLAKCSQKVRRLHNMIKSAKFELSKCKEDMKLVAEIPLFKWRVKYAKTVLSAYRHKLARLKGMDRVAVPYEVMRFGFEANVPRVSYNCECFEPIDRKHKYCPNCGRRILWEKVK